jgi:hypothetical protein
MSEPIYYERLLAPLLGISREDLIYLRGEVLKKKKGAWRRDGRDIVIAHSGLTLILERLRTTSNRAPVEIDLSTALVPSAVEKNQTAIDQETLMAAAPMNGLAELTVVRCYPNPRMVRATTADGQAVDVRVKTNKNFVPRMTLKARLVTAGKYEMEGRCPRTRGRY